MPGGYPSQIVHAATSGCPFCRSLFHLVPEVGEAVIFVTGSSVGSCGLVVPIERAPRPGDFWVSTDPATSTIHMCNVDYDRAIPVGAYDVPAWMAPLCMEDSAYLHAALADCFLLPGDARRAQIEDAVIAAVSCCWGYRLPVTGVEIWALLAGHGVHPELQDQITSTFDFGMTLMTRLKGRKPNQRRRMPAMSRIRYLTPHNEPLWANLKGYSNVPQVVCLPGGTLSLTPEGYERVSGVGGADI